MKKIQTIDGYCIDIYLYNSYGYNCHVFVANKPNEWVNGTNSKLYHMDGRDTYECFLSDVPNMTKEDVIRMFF